MSEDANANANANANALLHQLITIPELVSGHLISSVSDVCSSTGFPSVSFIASHRLPAVDAKRDYRQQSIYREDTQQYDETAALPVPLAEKTVLALPSPSGRLLFLVRKDGDDYLLEIFDRTRNRIQLARSVNGAHGAMALSGNILCGVNWHASERYIVYVAEPARPKPPTAGAAVDGAAHQRQQNAEESLFETSQFNHFGEQLSSFTVPKLFVLDCVGGLVIGPLPVGASLACGQPVWSDKQTDKLSVHFTGWDMQKSCKKLGLVAYSSRASSIYCVSFVVPLSSSDCSCVCVSAADQVALSPRMASNGDLYYLTSEPTLLHGSTMKLRVRRSGGDFATLVDSAPPADNEQFPGLYLSAMPQSPFALDHAYLLLTTEWRSVTTPVVVDTQSGCVRRLALPQLPALTSATVIEVRNDYILLSCSRPNSPFELFVGRFAGPDRVDWQCAHRSLACWDAEVNERLSKIRVEVVTVPADDARDGPLKPENSIEVIVCHPPAECVQQPGPPPLAAIIHGGPHSVISTQFYFSNAFICLSGYTLAIINYRGSTGFGSTALHSLPGKCGQQDIADCITAINAVSGEGQQRPVHLLGGSHGGFILGHLISTHNAPLPLAAKCPRFASAVSRNPVCDISAMTAVTDIPDWCFTECGMAYQPQQIIQPHEHKAQMERMFNASPMAIVDHASTPILLMIGTADRRVPQSQALSFYYQLKARGKAVELRVYGEAQHSLTDKVGQEVDVWQQTIKWMNKHNNTTQTDREKE